MRTWLVAMIAMFATSACTLTTTASPVPAQPSATERVEPSIESPSTLATSGPIHDGGFSVKDYGLEPVSTRSLDPTVAAVIAAHMHMSAAAWGSGGMQSWGWAVTSLEAAIESADADGDAALVDRLNAILAEARAIHAQKDRLSTCRNYVMVSEQSGDPGYEACFALYEQSRRRRVELHDVLVDDVYPLVNVVADGH